MHILYEKLNIASSCLKDEKIYKKDLLECANILSVDKKIIKEHIQEMICRYSLNPETTYIKPYISSEREYYEIEVLEISLNEISKAKRIAEIVMRTIPYPLFLIFLYKSQIQFVTGDMRKNLSDNSKVTVDDFVYTDWFDLENINEFVEHLLFDINILLSEENIKKLNSINGSYYDLYKNITSKLNIYNLSRVKNEIISETATDMSDSDIKSCYDKIQTIDNQIANLRAKKKKSGISIKEKVELELQINKLKKEKEDISNNI